MHESHLLFLGCKSRKSGGPVDHEAKLLGEVQVPYYWCHIIGVTIVGITHGPRESMFLSATVAWHPPGSLALRLHGNQSTKTHQQILLLVNLFSYMLQVIR